MKVKKIVNDRLWGDREREVIRVDLTRIAGEYRAYGDVEIVPTTLQHRHCGQWDYGHAKIERGSRG